MTTNRIAQPLRSLTFQPAAERAADGSIPVIVSSDAVVDVMDGPEILVHDDTAVDLQRAPLPIIATHRGGQVNVGNVRDLRIDRSAAPAVMRGMAHFGERQEASEYRRDVESGIIRSVSVGYARVKAKQRSDGVLVTTRWMPTHVAMVAEPADVRAGFYRQAPTFEIEADTSAPEISPPAALAASTERTAIMAIENQAAAGQPAAEILPAQVRQGPSAMDIEKSRVRAIENLCRANKIDNNIRDHWVGTGLPVEDITEDLLKILGERDKSNTTVTPSSRLGLTEKETQRFSLFRALHAAESKDWSRAGFELECTRAIAKALGKTHVDPNRIFVPMEIQERGVSPAYGQTYAAGAYRGQMADMMKRDLTVGTTTAGGFLVGTKNVSFIEVLRNRMMAARMGATFMPGQTESITIPRQTGAATAVWMANEGSTITESQQVFAQLALTPKTVGAYTEVSRQLLLQSNPAAEGIVTSDLASVCAIAYDLAALSGSGSAGQPTGITNTAGIGSVTGTSMDVDAVIEFMTDVAGSNVVPVSGGYATTHIVAGLLMQRVKFSGTASPLWEGNPWDGSVYGFPGMASLQMAAGTALFGDWSQLVIAEWGTLELEVNPYANFQSAITGIRAIVSMDCGLRYAGAFSLASSIT